MYYINPYIKAELKNQIKIEPLINQVINMVIDLSKFKDMNCAHCQGELLLSRKRQTNFAKCKNCGTIWMLTKSKDNKI